MPLRSRKSGGRTASHGPDRAGKGEGEALLLHDLRAPGEEDPADLAQEDTLGAAPQVAARSLDQSGEQRAPQDRQASGERVLHPHDPATVAEGGRGRRALQLLRGEAVGERLGGPGGDQRVARPLGERPGPEPLAGLHGKRRKDRGDVVVPEVAQHLFVEVLGELEVHAMAGDRAGDGVARDLGHEIEGREDLDDELARDLAAGERR